MHIEGYEKTIFEWKFSPMATYICPTFQVTRNESNSPRGLAFLLSLVTGNQRRPLDQSVATRMYQCISCYLCTSLGYDETDPASLFISARADAVEGGCAPEPVAHYLETLRSQGELAGQALKQIPELGKAARLGVFVDPFIAREFPHELEANLELLRHAGVSFGVPGADHGSGAQLFALGFWKEARQAALEAAEAVRSGSFVTLAFLSPYDYRAFRHWYAELDVSAPQELALVPMPALILEQVRAGTLRFTRKAAQEAPTYLDAGHFVRPESRHLEIEELLGHVEGLSFRFMWRNGRLAYPDSGDYLAEFYPDIAGAIDEMVLREVAECGADGVLTSCFYALRNLRAALAASGRELGTDPQVEDLGTFLHRHL